MIPHLPKKDLDFEDNLIRQHGWCGMEEYKFEDEGEFGGKWYC